MVVEAIVAVELVSGALLRCLIGSCFAPSGSIVSRIFASFLSLCKQTNKQCGFRLVWLVIVRIASSTTRSACPVCWTDIDRVVSTSIRFGRVSCIECWDVVTPEVSYGIWRPASTLTISFRSREQCTCVCVSFHTWTQHPVLRVLSSPFIIGSNEIHLGEFWLGDWLGDWLTVRGVAMVVVEIAAGVVIHE